MTGEVFFYESANCIQSRSLRRAATDAEKKLWAALRDRRLAGFKFRRQYPIGKFTVDFACYEKRLVVEADGSQHADNPADLVRTKIIEGQGWRVVRFWNLDILQNTRGVLESILAILNEG